MRTDLMRTGLKWLGPALLLATAAHAAEPAGAPTPPAPAEPAKTAAAPAPAEPAKTAAAPAPAEPWTLEATALEEYRGRYARAAPTGGLSGNPSLAAQPDEAESDHDLRFYLAGSARSPAGGLELDAALSLWADLNGPSPEDAPSPLASIHDQGNSALWFDVYTLSATHRTRGLLALARVGRQEAEHGPPAIFDGATLRVRAPSEALQVFAFGGRTVHFFDVDGGLFEDWLGSVGAVARPLKRLRLEVDYRLLREDTETRDNVVEHTYGGAVEYRPLVWLGLNGDVRGLDDRLERAGASARAESADGLRGAAVRAQVQPVSLDEISETSDPFSAVLGASRPHLRTGAEAWYGRETGIGTFIGHLGNDSRVLLHDDPSRFNRDYGRLFLTVEGIDLAVRGPFASVTGEYHYTFKDGTLERDRQFASGGTAGYESPALHGEVGAYYQRFRYTWFRDVEEVQEAQVYYLEGAYRPTPRMPIRVRYEIERSTERDVQTWFLTLAQVLP